MGVRFFFAGGPLKRSLRKWFNVQMAFEDVEEVIEGINFAVDDGGGENELGNGASAEVAIELHRILNVFFD